MDTKLISENYFYSQIRKAKLELSKESINIIYNYLHDNESVVLVKGYGDNRADWVKRHFEEYSKKRYDHYINEYYGGLEDQAEFILRKNLKNGNALLIVG